MKNRVAASSLKHAEFAEEVCPICRRSSEVGIGRHMRSIHGREAWEKAIVAAKDSGTSDREIGRRFNVSFNSLSKLLMRERGSGSFGKRRSISTVNGLFPVDFSEETTSLWSFRDRGSWAVHDGHYRGNWSPYIPRNVMLRYTNQGDLVLDCFVGGGTTAIEATLLGRDFVGIDVNPEAVRLATEAVDALREFSAINERQSPNPRVRIELGDARHLAGVSRESIDLICAHPPYAEIVKYSEGVEADLSSFKQDEYLAGMKEVASECMRVMKPAGRCVILVGDKRKQKRVVPLGFSVIQSYLDRGFRLDELIIKRQFNTRTSGLWYNKAIKWKFLLMAHEYLPVFSSGKGHAPPMNMEVKPVEFDFRLKTEKRRQKGWTTEASTVWKVDHHSSTVENFRRLTADGRVRVLEEIGVPKAESKLTDSVLADLTPESGRRSEVERRRGMLSYLSGALGDVMQPGTLLGVMTKDVRNGAVLFPMGMCFWRDMSRQGSFALREVVITDSDSKPTQTRKSAGIEITHGYLLIYEKT